MCALLCAAGIASPTLAADGLEPCRGLIAAARNAAADPAELAQAFGQPQGLFSSAIRTVDGPASPPPFAPQAAALFGADAAGTAVHLQPLGGSVWRAQISEGSLICQTDHLFRVDQDGHVSKLADLAAYGDLCFTSSREIAQVEGRPAMVETDQVSAPYSGVDVEVTPWDGGWGPTCRAALRYDDAFRVSERFCDGEPACGDAERVAPRLAEALARDPKGSLAAVAPLRPQVAAAYAGRVKVAEMAFARQNDGYGPLPTFGAKPKTPFPDYSGTSTVTLVSLDDRPFLARVGVGGVGWRPIGDYLVAFYTPDDGGLEPVASYVVQRQVTGVRSLAASVPRPVKPDR